MYSKDMAHAIYVKLQHWPCLASRLRPVKKLAPCFSKHARELPVIKSRNRKILDYIYISGTCGAGEKPPPPPSRMNDNSSFTESFFGYRVFQHGSTRPMSGA